jgi:hypothetical protein
VTLLLGVFDVGCYQAKDPPPPPSFDAPTAVPSSCEVGADDDLCSTCQKRSCCNEIAACNGTCKAWYQGVHDCLYPEGTWSGVSTKMCEAQLGVPLDPTMVALRDCLSFRCARDEQCAPEPRALFSYPTPASANFSAAQFFENYCNGCHSPGKVGPKGDALSVFTTNSRWVAPLRDPNWFRSMDYAVVVSKADVIACGVTADELPAQCFTLPSVRSGFFTRPAKFPPSGIGGYAMCPYTLPDGGCPQPTSFERARLLSWIADGTPL